MSNKTVSTVSLYEGIKSLIGNDTAYGVGKFMGTGPSTAMRWRDNRNTMDDSYAVKAAEALNLDTGFVLACLAAERAGRMGKPDIMAVWQRIAHAMPHAAMLAISMLCIIPQIKSPV